MAKHDGTQDPKQGGTRTGGHSIGRGGRRDQGPPATGQPKDDGKHSDTNPNRNK